MRILIVPDKFKGSLSAQEVAQAIKQGIIKSGVEHQVTTFPMADGGEGTSQILTEFVQGRTIELEVSDPLGRRVTARYGLSPDEKEAYIEMAAASGLALLDPREQNPAHTSTVGTGQMIKDAVERGVTSIFLCIGGSATNDAGIGMASALGVRFLDRTGRLVSPVGQHLIDIEKVNTQDLHPGVRHCEFVVLCDVANPLLGSIGAAAVFGPQKGADEPTVAQLERGMRHFANILSRDFNFDANFPGAGAAGGLAVAARIFLRAKVTSGIGFLIKFFDLDNRLSEYDLVITGEGKLDAQTSGGKAVQGISELCLKNGKPLWVVVGINELAQTELKKMGISRLIEVQRDGLTSREAMENAHTLIVEGLMRAMA